VRRVVCFETEIIETKVTITKRKYILGSRPDEMVPVARKLNAMEQGAKTITAGMLLVLYKSQFDVCLLFACAHRGILIFISARTLGKALKLLINT
jgi:metal-dependent hydrolase (beta-lactamase superfamily II)